MADSISIVMEMNDDISAKLKSIASTSKGVSKEFEVLQNRAEALGKRYDHFNQRAAETSAKALGVKRSMDEAAKAFKETGDEAQRVSFKKLKAEYDSLNAASKTYTNSAEQTRRAMRDTYDQFRKLEDSGGAVSDTGGGFLNRIFGSDLGGKLSQAGIAMMLGNVVASGADIFSESIFGQPTATLSSSIISGITSGAAAGAMAGIPVIGAVAGGISGVASGALQIYQQKDEAFKDYYQGLYETVNAGTDEDLTAGSTVAGGREQTRMAFSQRLGDDKAAAAYLEQVQEMAKDTNYTYDEITGYSKLLLNSYGQDETLDVLMRLSDATAGLNLSSSDIEMFIAGLSRMRTTGKATQEYLNYFSERGVDVYQALADATGAAKSSIADMVSGGDISGSTAAQAILDYIQREYGGLSEQLAGTYDAMTDNLGDVMTDIQAAGGSAYNEARKEGLEADLAAYGGTLGEKLAEINAVAGEVKAYGENLESQFQREALSAVLEGAGTTVFGAEDQQKLEEMRVQFQEASEAYENGSLEAGQKMVDLKEQAEALATAAYESSEWYQTMQDGELEQITAIRGNTAGLEAATNALEISNAFSKGQAPVYLEHMAEGLGVSAQESEGLSDYMSIGEIMASSHAYGLKYVPHDNYPILAHQGERLLTAQEARAQDRAGTGGVSVTITGPVTVRQESDIDAIAARLADEIEARALAYGG